MAARLLRSYRHRHGAILARDPEAKESETHEAMQEAARTLVRLREGPGAQVLGRSYARGWILGGRP
jgi:hypothetical protein